MATLAMWLRRAEAAADSRQAQGVTSPFALRSLPYEDLFFYKKQVDNTRLVRQQDPRESGECWSTIGAVCAVTMVLITTLAPGVASLLAGYQIQELEAEHHRLVNEQRVLEAREAELLNPERLERWAERQQLKPPAPGQVIHLQQASPGTVALNLDAEKGAKKE
ncbi:MAG: hypothetical protein ACKV22_36755 [Bryobacteraceae bacterium]